MGFRKQLQTELESWRDEGLVSDDQARALTDRYRLHDLEKESRNTLLAWFFLLGAVLIGCGITAFVAAHWDEIPKALKAAVLLIVMLTAHGAGYYLWRIRRVPRAHLGHALTVLGTLVLGANIALFAQIFQISGHLHQAYLAWAVGALLMAYALFSVPHAVVAVCASFVGYVLLVEEYDQSHLLYSLVVMACLLPLSYHKHSRVLFFFTLVAATASLIVNGCINSDEGWTVVFPFVLNLTALWAYGLFHHDHGNRAGFGIIARLLGTFGLAATAYVMSFHELMANCAESAEIERTLENDYYLALSVPLLALTFFAVAGMYGRPAAWRSWIAPFAVCGLLLLATVLPEAEIYSTIACNMAAFFLAGYGIYLGLICYRRVPYWAGLAYMVLLISSRFFEYESHLMIKSASFVVAGLALILGGIKFENRLRMRKNAHQGGDDE